MSIPEALLPRKASFGTAAKVFVPSCVFILASVYFVWPRLGEAGAPALLGYLLCFQTTPFLLLFVQLAVYLRRDGQRGDLSSLADRLRLGFRWKPVLWGVGVFVVGAVTYLGLQPVSRYLAGTTLFAPPAWFPPDLHPLKASAPGSFMGYAMAGKFWPALLWTAGWTLNIVGEELLFRGYLLPLQERAYGGRAWLVNGVMWNLWHVFWRWQMLASLPFHLLVPFVAQKTRSTWPGLVAHGLLNSIVIVLLIRATLTG
jgi:membrane protease YdiL (CAAX protease family)